MVHTAELTYFPNHVLIEEFKKLDSTRYLKQLDMYSNEALKTNGIILKMRKIKNGKFESVRFICRINFKKVIAPDTKVQVATIWDFQDIEEEFNRLISQLCPSLPRFASWKVNRIDYCFNVHTPYVSEYLSLLKKGNRPHLRNWYDEQRNYTQKQGSLYLVSTAKHKRNRSITVNFYDKQDEIIKTHDLEYALSVAAHGLEYERYYDFAQISSMLEESDNILRLEIQCHRIKTETLRKKYFSEEPKLIRDYLNPDIAHDLVEYYLRRIAGTADYLRKPVALKRINELKCKTETKDKLKQIINDVAKQHQNVSKVREQYIKEGIASAEEFSYLIHYLQEHNINPVTIRSNLKLEDKHLDEGLPNLLGLFEEAYWEEMAKED